MTTELYAALIGAVVLLLTNLAALVKVWSDNAKIRAERAETKTRRDSDSDDLHDQCKKNSWEILRLKEDNTKRDSLLESIQGNVNELNTNLLLVSQELRMFSSSIVNAINDLKKEGKSG